MGNDPVFFYGRATSELPGKGWHSVYAYDEAEYQEDEEGRTPPPLYRVFVQVARGDDGQLICTGLLFGGDNKNEVTARALRAIPMSTLLRSLSRDDRLIGKGSTTWPAWPLNRTRAGSKGLPLRHFEEVAKGYREALQEAPRAPVKYLAERWHHPEATIRTWLKQARDRGLLGAATHGKAGEKPLPPKTRRKK
jgi:hypothetical protein